MNSASTSNAADQPELLADDGEDEVGVRVGEEVPLGPAGAEPDAGEPAAPQRDQRLRDLVPRVGRVGERVRNVSMRARRYGSAIARNVTAETPSRGRSPRGAAAATPPATSTATDDRAPAPSPSRGRAPSSRARRTRRAPAAPAARRAASRRAHPPAGSRGRPRRAAARAWRARWAGSGATPAPSHRREPDDVDADARDQHDHEQHARCAISSGRTSARQRAVVEADREHERGRGPTRSTSAGGGRSTTASRSR